MNYATQQNKKEEPPRIKMLSPLSTQDLEALAKIWIESWRGVFPQIDFESRTPWLRTHLADIATVRGGRILAGYLDRRLSGFVTIEPDTGYLDQLAVHPCAQGTGLAQDLLAAARVYSPKRLCLDVNADNARAIAFYLRAGFKQIGEDVNVSSGMKTLKLEWRLNESCS